MSVNMDNSKNSSTLKMSDNRDESHKTFNSNKGNAVLANIKDRVKFDGARKKESVISEQNFNIIQEAPIIKRDSHTVMPLIPSTEGIY